MAAALYTVKKGDTLWRIAQKYGTTVSAIMAANVICNSNLIFPGEILIIPDPNLPLPRAGGLPYYIVRPSDTLYCLAQEFGTSVRILAQSNQISNPNLILLGQELLVIGEIPDPYELRNQWETLGGWECDMIPPLSIHGIFYNGSFLWEALGQKALPFLIPLLDHWCNIVRMYTVISLARIARNHAAVDALLRLVDDPDPVVRELVPLALARIALARTGRQNIHLTISSSRLYDYPNYESSFIELPVRTRVTALRWHIPSPTGEEGPRGDIQIYDLVTVIETGKTGYLPRVGFNEIVLV